MEVEGHSLSSNGDGFLEVQLQRGEGSFILRPTHLTSIAFRGVLREPVSFRTPETRLDLYGRDWASRGRTTL